MTPDFESRLRAFAEVVVRVGLNLQQGQRLLMAEPYELQGVARSGEIIVGAVKSAALAAGCPAPDAIEIIWGDASRLREIAATQSWGDLNRLLAANARKLGEYITAGDALLFLQGSQPKLLDGIPAAQVAELRRISWEHFGPIAQQLVQGATNWTVAPAPSPGWAHSVFADLPSEQRLEALWETVFAACRVAAPQTGLAEDAPALAALNAWQAHLQSLRNCRDGLNAQPLRTVRYLGPGTDLRLVLPPEHRWFTAQLATQSGLPFVANLPTEEVFTLPHRDSAEGTVRISRPINYGGAVIDGIELTFHHGVVERATATTNEALLQRLLATDEGASRLGEVALVLRETTLARAGRLFHHPLLDENAANHIALGEAYAFCLRTPNPRAINRSLIHVDLPLDARVTLSKKEPF